MMYAAALHCIIRKTHVSTDELINMFKEGRTVPRKGHTQKRDVLADPLYNNKVVTKLINNIMLDGKKGVAQKIVYGAFDRVAEKTDKPAIEVFEEAMNNIMPVLEVKARRIGGATYQVPIEVRADRRQALALRWLTNCTPVQRGEKTMEERLANEIHGCCKQYWRIRKEKRRYAQDGRSKQSICSLQILNRRKQLGWKRISIRENQKYRYHGAYRCW